MIETRKLLEQFAGRMESLLAKAPEPTQLMSEILEASEQAGITDSEGGIRHDSPARFVQDLLTDNPAAYEWMQNAREWVKPLQLQNAEQMLDAIR